MIVGDLTANRRVREKAAMADWADVRDVILRVSAFKERPTQRLVTELFAPFGIVRDISFKKRKRNEPVAYCTLLGSARRAFRACRALSRITRSSVWWLLAA